MKPLPDSIRWQIFLYYTALFVAALAFLAAAHFWTDLRAGQHQAERRMQEMGFQLSPFVFPPSEDPGSLADPAKRPVRAGPVDNPVFHHRVAELMNEGIYLVAVNWQGREIFRSPNAPAGFSVSGPAGGPFSLAPDAGTLGVVVVPSVVGDVVALGQPRATIEKQAFRTLPLAVGLGAVTVAFFSFVGFRLIGSGLRPVREISRAAAGIAGGNLSERINAKGQRSELGDLARVLNRTFDHLEDMIWRQTRFIADASHELRAPVAVILAGCELSRKCGRDPARYRETIDVCHEAGLHLRDLIDGLGLLAQFDSRELAVSRAPCDLEDIAKHAADLVGPLAQQAGITVLPSLGPAPCEADRSRLLQVALNLLRNAIQYNKPGGQIRLRTGRAEGGSFLEVEDSGVGIAPEMQGRIFDRFFRADVSRGQQSGNTGLGLAICKAIVEAHGGTIAVSSEPGTGSTFRITLPE